MGVRLDPELLTTARAAIRQHSGPSVLKAFGAVVTFVFISLAFAGVAFPAGLYDMDVLISNCILCLLLWPAAFCVFEFFRFREHSILLRELMQQDKYYEALLTDARRERDEARNQQAAGLVALEAIRSTN